MQAYAEEEERKDIYFNQRQQEQKSSVRKDNIKSNVKSVRGMTE